MIGDCIAWLCSHLGVAGLLVLDVLVFAGFAQFMSRLREW